MNHKLLNLFILAITSLFSIYFYNISISFVKSKAIEVVQSKNIGQEDEANKIRPFNLPLVSNNSKKLLTENSIVDFFFNQQQITKKNEVGLTTTITKKEINKTEQKTLTLNAILNNQVIINDILVGTDEPSLIDGVLYIVESITDEYVKILNMNTNKVIALKRE